MCPPWLGRCVRLAGLVSGLSPIWSGMLCPPRWSCLSLVFGLVSQLVSHLVWDAVSASLVVSSSCLRSCLSQLVSHLVWDAVSASLVVSFSCLRPCLPACLPSGLGCCVRLAGRVFLLSTVLSLPACLPSGLGCCVCLAGRVFLLSSALSPSLSPISSGMLCPPRWSCLPLVYGLVSPSLSPIWSGMLYPPRWSCLSLVFGLVSQLVSHLVWDAVSASLFYKSSEQAAVNCFLLSPVLSPSLSSSWSGMRCLCSGVVHKKSCAIGETVWGLRWCNFKYMYIYKVPTKNQLSRKKNPVCIRYVLGCTLG